jgi:hypothetical protein
MVDEVLFRGDIMGVLNISSDAVIVTVQRQASRVEKRMYIYSRG